MRLWGSGQRAPRDPRVLTSLSGRHAGIRDSIAAALGNVNPYTLFDVALSKDGGDVSPSAVSQDTRIPE